MDKTWLVPYRIILFSILQKRAESNETALQPNQPTKIRFLQRSVNIAINLYIILRIVGKYNFFHLRVALIFMGFIQYGRRKNH